MSKKSFEQSLVEARQLIDDELERWLKKSSWGEDFQWAVRHCISGAGKAFRPALFLHLRELLVEKNLFPQAQVDFRCLSLALEMLHTYSLIHDDLPAMDNDPLRRGRATLHVLKGEAFGVLAGDALLTGSFELLAEAFAQTPEALPAVVKNFAQAVGAAGMIEGQWQDMQSGHEKDLATIENRHRLKTGALIGASAEFALWAAWPVAEAQKNTGQYRLWGENLGLLFQFADDLLDETASAREMGKTQGKDKDQGKGTYANQLNTDAQRSFAEKLKKSLVEQVPAPLLAAEVKELVDFVVQRKN